MSHIIHTPIIYSVVRKPLDDGSPLAKTLREVAAKGQLFLSAVSHGNILCEIDRIEEAPLRTEAHQNYGQLLAHVGSSRILPFDEPVSRVWGEIRGIVRPGTAGASAEALMIAATSQAYGFKMITTHEAWHDILPDVDFCHV